MKYILLLISAAGMILLAGVFTVQGYGFSAEGEKIVSKETTKSPPAESDGDMAEPAGKGADPSEAGEAKPPANEDDDTRSELKAAVYANLEASRQEDLETYMYTLHKESPHYEATRELMKNTFANYELDYELNEISVSALKGMTAQVRFSQSTLRISGPEFQDNHVTGIHVLRKDRGKWKIFNTRLINVEQKQSE